MRTAGSALPPTVTCPTPSTWDSRCARMVDAASYICPRDSVGEVSARMTIGASAGFTLRHVGLLGIPLGNSARVALMPACTSLPASWMLRDRSNWIAIRVEPSELEEVISLTPAMRPSVRSSGVAMVAAIVSGLAPGSEALTTIVGKSTCGSGDTGNWVKAARPDSRTARASSVVAIGRAMDGALRLSPTGFMPPAACRRAGRTTAGRRPGRSPAW